MLIIPPSRLFLIKKCINNIHQRRHFVQRNLLTLKERAGFIQDIFPSTSDNEISELFRKSPQTIYAGFDPTASSLHVGNLLVIMGLLHAQRGGHYTIALLGGATALIGDPSGRKTERKHISDLQLIENNTKSIETQLLKIFQNHQDCLWPKKKGHQELPLKPLRIVNNIDWYRQRNIIEFIGKMGRHFRLGSMLSRTSVQTRLEADGGGISFSEFSYQIFQAYDWLYLLDEYNCRFQMGGSDQMGNLMTGHELISRAAQSPELRRNGVYGITLPLVTDEEGDKFGKSGGNAVWLDESLTSAFSLYQFFVRKTDAEVEKLLKLFTFLKDSEIRKLMHAHVKEPEKRMAQTILAEDVTLLVHGEKGLKQAERITEALYKGNLMSLSTLNCAEIQGTLKGATVVDVLAEPDLTILQLAMKAKCFHNETDAIRIISAGGFYINQKRAQNVAELITNGIHILENGLTLLRVGKRNFYIVRWIT